MKKSIHFIHWIPRVLCMLAILFISLFALDSFEPGAPMVHQLGHFFMHLIPSFVLTFFLLVAWKWELPGGIIFVILGLGFLPPVFMMNYHMNHSVLTSLSVVLVINIPFVVVGALFVLSHFLKSRQENRE